jgi:hypothetical protein
MKCLARYRNPDVGARRVHRLNDSQLVSIEGTQGRIVLQISVAAGSAAESNGYLLVAFEEFDTMLQSSLVQTLVNDDVRD